MVLNLVKVILIELMWEMEMNEHFFCKCLKMWRQPVVKFLYIAKGSSDFTIWLNHTFQKEKNL